MNARHIIDVFKRTFSPHIKTRLGRWNIHNYSETALKIKYATEDNCGISFNNYKNITQIEQIQAIQQKNETDYDDNKYIHMMGYESVHQ